MTPSNRTLVRAGAALLLSGAVLFAGSLASRSASATTLPHLSLLRSSPVADTTLTASPTDIRLWFSQAPEMAATTVRLTASSGTVMALDKPQRDKAEGAPVIAALQRPLAPDVYEVAWRTMSRDGHVVKGQFSFTIAATGTGRAR